MAGTSLSDLRILPFNRDAGAFQLAATEAVIDAVGGGRAPATLRMYSWSRDSLILGVGQHASGIDVEACRDAGCDILRRISGGTAVFHDGHTVSFQLVLPQGHPFLTDDIHVNYRRIAEIAIAMLASLEVPARWATIEEARRDVAPPGLDAICFSSLAPYEIVCGGRKLVGLAQVRRQTVSALQGMLYLRTDVSKSVRLVSRDPDSRSRLVSVLAQRTIDLATAAGRDVSAEEVVSRFSEETVKALNATAVESPLSAWELDRARELERTRYANPDWTFRR